MKAWLRSALLCGLALPVAHAQASDAWLAWQPEGASVQTQTFGPAALPGEVPLGSTWKLFMHVYLQASKANEPAYRCDGVTRQRAPGDEYCCEPGDSVTRDAALERSCGRYFEPTRLAVDAQRWHRFWQRSNAPAWLADLSRLRPQTLVSVPELLAALAAVPPAQRDAAREALGPVALSLGDGRVLAAWGSGPRFKTFSWAHPRVPGASIGGAAGWLGDGTPFWLGGLGTSRAVVPRLAAPAAAVIERASLAPTPSPSPAAPCVHVDYLARYPVRQVLHAATQQVVAPGVLTQRYVVQLLNGRSMPLHALPAAGEISLEAVGGALRLSGRFTLNEYVARVIDREADARHTEAARALAVAARSYLVQNAGFEGGCWRIADHSRTQRVSLNPASAAARAVAAFTDELVLQGRSVRYHRDRAAPGVLSWQAAVQAAAEGQHFVSILRRNWPQAQMALLSGQSDCKPVPAAQAWMAQSLPQWRRRLMREPGFEPPAQWAVCELAYGHPYADVRRARIYVRHWQTPEGRLSLAHEFVHLAFARHPNGSDERYAEHWARRLVDPLAADNGPALVGTR
jgi:uncharacterized protein YfaQ (DUF2300 family)